MISKKEHPSTRKCTRGQQSTTKITRIKEIKKRREWLVSHGNHQSNKVLKKNNLRFGMDLSLSSKHLLFLLLQRHHIKQWGTINHIWPFRWWPNLPCQQASSPKTDCNITQLTPNKPKTIDYISIATRQWRKRWLIDSPLHLHM